MGTAVLVLIQTRLATVIYLHVVTPAVILVKYHTIKLALWLQCMQLELSYMNETGTIGHTHLCKH